MFSFIRSKYRAWTVRNKLERYEALIEDIDGGNCKPEEFALKLKEFWRLFDMELLNDLSVRDVMGHQVLLRHRTFGQLFHLFVDANDAIAKEEDSRIEYVTRTGMGQQADVDLESYFQDPQEGYLTIRECFDRIRLLLIAHCGITENIEGTYGQRKMLHVYYDILQLSDVILDVIEQKEFTDTQ
uniref:Uncharacterized protein n=1 Tax=Pseudomonas phage RVTF4 TaxID=3236931 RepID=A0AB39CDF2_9VIRU